MQARNFVFSKTDFSEFTEICQQMWPHTSISEFHDSDQSISDVDDEQNPNWPENYVSLAVTSDHKKEELGVASRLELLKGFHQDIGFSSEDEVEMPDFHDTYLDCKKNVGSNSISSKPDDSTFVPDERISGVKKGKKPLFKSISSGHNVSEVVDLTFKEHDKLFEPCASSALDEEKRRLDPVKEKSRWSLCRPFDSKDRNPGAIYNTRRGSSQLHPHKAPISSVWKDNDLDPASDDELFDEAEACGDLCMKKTSSVLEYCHGETMIPNLGLPMEAAMQHDHRRHSMAELLDNLQGKIRNPHLKSKMGRRRKGLLQSAVTGTISSSGKDTMSDEDPCEILDGDTSPDNENNAQISELAVVESGRKTMADKFQEAFECASVDGRRPSFVVPKQSCSGLFGRLQCIMQGQKEQDADFLKRVQTEVWPKDEARCIDVKISSRSFDAKLSVCCCSLIENEESSLQNPQQEGFGKMWTVIFNSRVCGDVDLDVGNLIRICPPWREVQVQPGGEIIILATYYSQMCT